MVSITIEIPDELAKQLEAAGLLNSEAFLAAAIHRLQSQPILPSRTYTQEEMEAAIEEIHTLFADSNFTMADYWEMKGEELALEERKMKLIFGEGE